MIRKLSIFVFFLVTLNGCVQGVAFLGPVFSYSQSGNIVQSALSLGSNHAIKRLKTKTSTENKKNTFDNDRTNINDYSFLLIKNKIDNSSGITNLANQ
jgi:hypothetical protein